MSSSGLIAFIKESNAIENIHRPPLDDEVIAHEVFLARPSIDVIDLRGFVHAVAAAKLCDRRGIKDDLVAILQWANEGFMGAYNTHVAYELLHPFTDGNGRSGRVLWAWMVRRSGGDPFALPFLRAWYYASLDAAR